MSTHTPHLILSAAIAGWGYHPGASGLAKPLSEVGHYRRLLQTAERGLLDFVLLHDQRALPEGQPYGRIDALTLLARLAPETSALGLAVSVPTTYSEPFNVSRELATLDFVSGGRAAWHVTSAASTAEAHNFGRPHAPPAGERRAIAEEFTEVSRKLWDSWEDDAIITDRVRGLYLDPTKLHHINHAGRHFQIRGPQITYRPPQGHVVVVHADQGDPGAPLSAASADVLILHQATLAEAQHAYTQHQQEAAALGREVRILVSLLPILGSSEAQAHARAAELEAAAASNGGTWPHALRFVGTPTQLADLIAQWFAARAADGFHLLPTVLPDGLDELVDQLVPELQRRDLFRSAYAGQTLRQHLGLSRPVSRYGQRLEA